MAPPDADDASAPRPTSGPTNFLSDIYSRLTSPSDPSPPPNSRFSSDGTAKPTLASWDDESTGKPVKKPLYKRKWFIIMNIVVVERVIPGLESIENVFDRTYDIEVNNSTCPNNEEGRMKA